MHDLMCRESTVYEFVTEQARLLKKSNDFEMMTAKDEVEVWKHLASLRMNLVNQEMAATGRRQYMTHGSSHHASHASRAVGLCNSHAPEAHSNCTAPPQRMRGD